jgi:hypothetical protein
MLSNSEYAESLLQFWENERGKPGRKDPESTRALEIYRRYDREERKRQKSNGSSSKKQFSFNPAVMELVELAFPSALKKTTGKKKTLQKQHDAGKPLATVQTGVDPAESSQEQQQLLHNTEQTSNAIVTVRTLDDAPVKAMLREKWAVLRKLISYDAGGGGNCGPYCVAAALTCRSPHSAAFTHEQVRAQVARHMGTEVVANSDWTELHWVAAANLYHVNIFLWTVPPRTLELPTLQYFLPDRISDFDMYIILRHGHFVVAFEQSNQNLHKFRFRRTEGRVEHQYLTAVSQMNTQVCPTWET